MSALQRRLLPLCRLLVALGLGAVGGSPLALAATPADNEIRIGMVNAQTGPASALGQGMLAGARAVFNDVNAQGGVHGRKITLRVADDAYDPETTQEKTWELIEQDKVLALFGFVGTPTANAVLPMLREMDVPLVGVFSGARSLRQPVTPQLFNLRASYDEETDTLVQRLLEAGARKIAVVYQNDSFGLAVLAGVDAALKARKLAVHATGNYQRNTVAIRTALGAMADSAPEAIVIAGPYVPVAAFVQEARQMGSKALFATVSFVGTESLLSKLGSDAEGMLISQVVPSPRSTTTPVVEECRSAVKRNSDEALTYINLEGCMSARLLVRALQDAGPNPTRKALTDALEAMKDVDLGGFPIGFSATDHQASTRVFVTRVLGGQATVIR